MTADLKNADDRLRAALHARADLVTAESLRPVHPVAPAPRRAARWVVPSLIATAAAAALVVTTSLVVPKLSASPAPPAHTAPPAPTPVSPAPKAGYEGVGLRLPAGWTLETVEPAGPARAPSGCVLRPGAARPGDPADCDLQVVVGGSWQYGLLINPDWPTGLRGLDWNPSRCAGTRPGVRDTVTVAGRLGQHRTIVVGCPQGERTVEQWVFGDQPAVVFVRGHAMVRPADDAAVRRIVTGASLPAGLAVATSGYGRLLGVEHRAGGTWLTVQGYRPRGMWTTHDVPAEGYDHHFRLAPGVQVLSAVRLCGDPTLIAYDSTGLGGYICPLPTLLDRLKVPGQGAVGAMVWFELDPTWAITRIVEEHH
jgi:hypothetical protein